MRPSGRTPEQMREIRITRNYTKHAEESGMEIPKEPVLFFKATSALTGPFDEIIIPKNSKKTDWEVELAIIIGKKTSYIFSVRRSYLQFLFSAIGLPFLPTFNDYQLKVKTNFNAKNQLSLISIGSLDKLSINNGIENPTPSQEYIATHTKPE